MITAKQDYYITICTENRVNLFDTKELTGSKSAVFNLGEDQAIICNEYGKAVADTWLDLLNHNSNIALDKFVVMPNHFHGILIIQQERLAGLEPATTKPLTEIVRQLKTFSAKQINELRGIRGMPIWQRGYYEEIIRDEQHYQNIWQYIDENPLKWKLDKYYRE